MAQKYTLDEREVWGSCESGNTGNVVRESDGKCFLGKREKVKHPCVEGIKSGNILAKYYIVLVEIGLHNWFVKAKP